MKTASVGFSLSAVKKGQVSWVMPLGVMILGAHILDSYTLVVDYATIEQEPEFDAAGRYLEPKRLPVHFHLAQIGEYLSRHHSWCAPVKVGDSQYLFYAFS